MATTSNSGSACSAGICAMDENPRSGVTPTMPTRIVFAMPYPSQRWVVLASGAVDMISPCSWLRPLRSAEKWDRVDVDDGVLFVWRACHAFELHSPAG